MMEFWSSVFEVHELLTRSNIITYSSRQIDLTIEREKTENVIERKQICVRKLGDRENYTLVCERVRARASACELTNERAQKTRNVRACGFMGGSWDHVSYGQYIIIIYKGG